MKIKTINTNRLVLRKLTQNDVEDIYQIFSSDTLMIPYGMNSITSLKKAQKLLDDMINDGEWGIILKGTNSFIGTIGFVGFKEAHKRAEIAFELKDQYWNKGYMSEALNAVISYFFNESDMNRLEAFVYPTNKASIKLLEHCGFIKEGYLREYVLRRGKLQDYLLYAMLKNDYLAIKDHTRMRT